MPRFKGVTACRASEQEGSTGQDMPIWPFHRSRAELDGQKLVDAVTDASRRPEFFGNDRIPDTMDGRFELMALNGAMAMVRLQSDPTLRPLAQTFTDRLFSLFDAGLREAGASDTAVPKRMHRLAGEFYGRLDAYSAALNDPPALAMVIARNVWRTPAHPFAPALARYVTSAAASQASAPISVMFTAEGWPPL